jgi:hypothetical protein
MDKARNDLTEQKLQGNVKSVMQIIYRAVMQDGKITRGDRDSISGSKIFTAFNEKGNTTEEIWFEMDNTIGEKRVYEYDQKDKKTVLKTYVSTLPINEETEEGAAQDAQLQKDAAARERSDGLFLEYKTTWEYNEKGRPVKEAWYSRGVAVCSNIQVCHYDDRGNKIRKEYFTPCSRLDSYTVYKHDDRGNTIEEVTYLANGRFNQRYVNSYDSADNQVGVIAYFTEKEPRSKQLYKYDKHGNRTEFAMMNPDGIISYKYEHTYEFDSTGNWISKVTVFKGSLQTITEREIKYYPSTR